MTLRFTDKPQGYSSQQSRDPLSRFPAHSRSMNSAPVGARPILLYEPNAKPRWGLHHMGAWREVERVRDPYTGGFSVRMNGSLVSNPVRWSSS
jgi:hypothetical protein